MRSLFAVPFSANKFFSVASSIPQNSAFDKASVCATQLNGKRSLAITNPKAEWAQCKAIHKRIMISEGIYGVCAQKSKGAVPGFEGNGDQIYERRISWRYSTLPFLHSQKESCRARVIPNDLAASVQNSTLTLLRSALDAALFPETAPKDC